MKLNENTLQTLKSDLRDYLETYYVKKDTMLNMTIKDLKEYIIQDTVDLFIDLKENNGLHSKNIITYLIENLNGLKDLI